MEDNNNEPVVPTVSNNEVLESMEVVTSFSLNLEDYTYAVDVNGVSSQPNPPSTEVGSESQVETVVSNSLTETTRYREDSPYVYNNTLYGTVAAAQRAKAEAEELAMAGDPW